MKLATQPLLDALCAEYLLGTLRGAARRRFERALREEPPVGAALGSIARRYLPLPGAAMAVPLPADGWPRLARALGLDAPVLPWYRRLLSAPAMFAAAAVAVVAIALALYAPQASRYTDIARMVGDEAPAVVASISGDRRQLQLRAAQPGTPPPGRVFQLWMLPPEGGTPRSLGILPALDTQVDLPRARAEELRPGALIEVSIEPPGGSPTGRPTGPVILIGKVS